MSKFQKYFSLCFSVLFTFATVSTSFPPLLVADEPQEESPKKSKDRRIFESSHWLEMTRQASRLDAILSQALYEADEIRLQLALKQQKPPTPGVTPNSSCLQCHELPKKMGEDRPEKPVNVFPLSDPLIKIIDFIRSDFPKDPLGKGGTADERYAELVTEIWEYKKKVEAFLSDPNGLLWLQLAAIHSYAKIIIHFMVLKLMVFPRENPFRELDEEFPLKIDGQVFLRIRRFLSEPESSKALTAEKEDHHFYEVSRKLFSDVFFYRDDGPTHLKLYFTDAFKVDVELSAKLHSQNEAAWLHILKIETLRYLTKQLITLSDYWPHVMGLNKRFISELSSELGPIGSLNASRIFDTKEKGEEALFRKSLISFLTFREIPTLFTVERFRWLISELPRTKIRLTRMTEEEKKIYWAGVEERSKIWIEREKQKTVETLTGAIEVTYVDFSKKSSAERGAILRGMILDIKRKFIHDFLISELFVEKEIANQDVSKYEECFVQEYERELTPERAEALMADLSLWDDENFRADQHFRSLDLSLTMPLMELSDIDSQIDALLISAFHKNLSWAETKRKYLETLHPHLVEETIDRDEPMGKRWIEWGMEERTITTLPPTAEEYEKQFMRIVKTYPTFQPPIPDPKTVKPVLPISQFPELKPILYSADPENPHHHNFKFLLSILCAPLSGNPFFLERIGKLRDAKNKEELVSAHAELVKEVKQAIDDTDELGAFSYGWYRVKKYFEADLSKEEAKQHQRDALELTLKQLEEFGNHLNRVDPKNLENLADFFIDHEGIRAEIEQLRFLKTKRMALINSIRILDMPVVAQDPPAEKPLADHLWALDKQDGILITEIEDFLINQRKKLGDQQVERQQTSPFSVPYLYLTLGNTQKNLERLKEEYESALRLIFEEGGEEKSMTPLDVKVMLSENAKIVKELRQLEKKIKIEYAEKLPSIAYLYPESFIGYKKNGKQIDHDLQKIVSLRQQRKEIYLDRGGDRLDFWMKRFLTGWLTKEAQIEQDFLIRNNMFKVAHATSVEGLKEFFFDPFILKAALKEVERDYGYQNEKWRVKVFEGMHERLVKRYSHTLLNSYFESSFRSRAFWGGIVLLLILSVAPGGQLPAYMVSMILFSDFATECGYELHDSFVTLPAALENKRGFFRSAVTINKWDNPTEKDKDEEKNEAEENDDGDGPSSLFEIEGWEQMLTFKRAISVGSTAIFLFPWARGEVKNTLRLIHSRANWFTVLKVPYYARQLGIGSNEVLTLPLIRKNMAEKLGISGEELLRLMLEKDKKGLRLLIRNKLGREEGEQFLKIFSFFHNQKTLHYLHLTTFEKCAEAFGQLGFQEGQWPTLLEARKNAQKRIDRLIADRWIPRFNNQAYELLIQKEIKAIEGALTFLEAHKEFLLQIQYSLNPKMALEALGLTIDTLPSRAEVEAFYQVIQGGPKQKAAWNYLKTFYELTPENIAYMEGVHQQLLLKNVRENPEAFLTFFELIEKMKELSRPR